MGTHFQLLSRKTIPVAIWSMQTQRFQMYHHEPQALAIDSCDLLQQFDKFHISTKAKIILTQITDISIHLLTDITLSSCRNFSLTMFNIKFSVLKLSKFIFKRGFGS